VLSTLAQTPDGDLLVTTKGPKMVYGAEAVSVLAQNNLRQQPGEDFLLPLRGHDYLSFLGKGVNATAIRSDIAGSMATVSGVEQVISCVVTVVKDTLNVDLALGTDEAQTEFSIAL